MKSAYKRLQTDRERGARRGRHQPGTVIEARGIVARKRALQKAPRGPTLPPAPSRHTGETVFKSVAWPLLLKIRTRHRPTLSPTHRRTSCSAILAMCTTRVKRRGSFPHTILQNRDRHIPTVRLWFVQDVRRRRATTAMASAPIPAAAGAGTGVMRSWKSRFTSR